MAWSITDEIIDEAIQLVKQGKCKHIVDLCCHFEVCRSTWYRAIEALQCDTIKRKVRRLDDEIYKFWVNLGLSGKADKTAWVMCVKNILYWRDRAEVDVSSSQGLKIEIK